MVSSESPRVAAFLQQVPLPTGIHTHDAQPPAMPPPARPANIKPQAAIKAPAPLKGPGVPAQATFKAPEVELGQPVWWYDERNSDKRMGAVVTAVANENVDLWVFIPGSLSPLVRQGVRHREDPNTRVIDECGQGVWDYCQSYKNMHAAFIVLSDALDAHNATLHALISKVQQLAGALEEHLITTATDQLAMAIQEDANTHCEALAPMGPETALPTPWPVDVTEAAAAEMNSAANSADSAAPSSAADKTRADLAAMQKTVERVDNRPAHKRRK